jgi:small-conductance mechanosensitive channel
MTQSSDPDDAFDPSAEIIDHCLTHEDAEHVTDTAAKYAYRHIRQAHQTLTALTEAIENDDTTDQVTIKTDTRDAQTDVHQAVDLLDTSLSTYRDQFSVSRTGNDNGEERLSGALERTERAYDRLLNAPDAATIEHTYDQLTDAASYLDRAVTQLTATLNHETYDDCFDTIVWDELSEATGGGDSITVNGYCLLCGKEYEQFFEFTGIWDNDIDDYVFRR